MSSKNIESILIELSQHPKITERKFISLFPEAYAVMQSWNFPDGFTFKQRLYHYINEDEELERGVCPTCGNRCSFISISLGYHRYCSSKCSTSSKEVQEKMAQACMEKYGTRHQMLSEKVKDKLKRTNIERYGTEWAFQSDSVKRKARRTNQQRYGVENPMQNESVRTKIKQTNIERYGTEYASQNTEIKKKVVETNLERYGVRYGLQSEEIRNKMKRTMFKKHGAEYSAQSKEISDKMKRTSREHYGTDYPICAESVMEKTKQSNLERYGVPWACMRPEARCHSAISNTNLAFAETLEKNGIEYEMELPLGSYSYDFKVGDMLIEIDPTITHNSYKTLMQFEGKNEMYHINKSKYAASNGYNCIHIWDWDDWNKIISMLKPKQTLYARKLELREVSEAECDAFLNEYHLQNTCKGQAVRLGLYMNDILVELMTFGKPRYNKHYEYELLRLCSHSDYIVVGGAERLFKHFVERYKPTSVISYCDASKFDGKVYERLCFGLKTISSPSKHWYNIKSGQHITDNLLRQRGFDQLFNASYGKGTSNEELMIEHGFLPLYDCGQMSFVYTA